MAVEQVVSPMFDCRNIIEIEGKLLLGQEHFLVLRLNAKGRGAKSTKDIITKINKKNQCVT